MCKNLYHVICVSIVLEKLAKLFRHVSGAPSRMHSFKFFLHDVSLSIETVLRLGLGRSAWITSPDNFGIRAQAFQPLRAPWAVVISAILFRSDCNLTALRLHYD